MPLAWLHFQPYCHAHLCELMDLWIEAWSRSYPGIDFEARRIWACDRVKELHETGVEFILGFDARNGTMAGWITLDRKRGHIDQLAVLPTYWGQGVADALLEAAKPLAPDVLRLEVNADNAAAIALYDRNGFLKTGEGVNPNSGKAIAYLEWSADRGKSACKQVDWAQ